ncbi:MAG: ATP-binding cassette domain-containing protein [Verrucomicrobiota bacterium]
MRLELQGLVKRYGAHPAVNGVDLSIGEKVRVLVLIGPSGGGKSTLLRILGGLERAEEGAVRVGDREMSGANESELQEHRRENGYLFQAFNLFPHLSLLRNVTLPLEKVHGHEPKAARERGLECLDRLGLGGMGGKMPAELSGGQQQRGGIARALAAKPKLLLLDEPTSALDPEMTAEVLAVIEELSASGQEIIMATHEMGFAKAVADHTLFLAEGKVVEEGADLFESPKEETVRRFLATVMRY